jgi:hypothetical protein
LPSECRRRLRTRKSATKIISGIESPGKDNGDDDEIAILSILRAMKDQGRAGVRAVRIFASSLKRMADAFEARDDELEEAAAAAHAALGDLHIGEDD